MHWILDFYHILFLRLPSQPCTDIQKFQEIKISRTCCWGTRLKLRRKDKCWAKALWFFFDEECCLKTVCELFRIFFLKFKIFKKYKYVVVKILKLTILYNQQKSCWSVNIRIYLELKIVSNYTCICSWVLCLVSNELLILADLDQKAQVSTIPRLEWNMS